MDDKLLLPGVFSGQCCCCFCFLVVSGLDHQSVRVGAAVVEEEEVSHDNLLCCSPSYIPDDVDRSSAEHDRATSISNRNHCCSHTTFSFSVDCITSAAAAVVAATVPLRFHHLVSDI